MMSALLSLIFARFLSIIVMTKGRPSSFMLHAKGNGADIDLCLQPHVCGQNGKLVLQPCDINNANQNWTYHEDIGTIEAGCNPDHRCIDVGGNSYKNGSSLLTYSCKATPNQQWIFEPINSYLFAMKSVGNPIFCITVPNDNFSPDTQLNLFQCSYRDNQLFYFEKEQASSNSDSSSSLSGGSIFLIILMSFVAMYCIIGYTVNGFKRKEWKDVKTNIPHYRKFWSHLPRLVIAGCVVTKEMLQQRVLSYQDASYHAKTDENDE